ncbi:hypothetical protein YTPLAS18_28070 [Nitrospira sp.]|nr:hypothetical protein YTPLAS18_28070 [Nitrospira sp.]
MSASDGCLLRIFVGESDRHDKRPLYEWIVTQAKAQGLAGATVVRGLMGFGGDTGVIHTFKIERLAEDLPIIVEIVDSEEKLDAFLRSIEPQIDAGWMATKERVHIRRYHGKR